MLVTALFNLGKFEENHARPPCTHYLKHCEFVLSCRLPLVIFTEPDLAKEIKATRDRLVPQDIAHSTFYITRNIQELKYFDTSTQEKIKKNWKSINSFVEQNASKITPAYLALMWNKFEFMKTAHDSFNVPKLAWIDIGIGQVTGDQSNSNMVTRVLNQSSIDCFSPTIMNPVTKHEFYRLDNYYGSWQYRLCGNFWTLGANVAQFFYVWIVNELQDMLNTGHLSPDEEIMGRFTYVHPSKCNFYFGDYASSISNRVEFKHDMDLARKAIKKADDFSLNHIAASGYVRLVHANLGGDLAETHQEMFFYLVELIVHNYYIDPSRAKLFGLFLLYASHFHFYFAKQIKKQEAFLNSILSFVNLDVSKRGVGLGNVVDGPEQRLIEQLQATSLFRRFKQWLIEEEQTALGLGSVVSFHTISSPWSALLVGNFHHFAALQRLVAFHGEEGKFTGSVFVDKNPMQLEPKLFAKQHNLYHCLKAQNPQHVVEVGVSAGHSLLLMLLTCSLTTTFTVFDCCEFKYCEPCVEYLNQQFGRRIELIRGWSPGILETCVSDLPGVDFYHLDSAHDLKTVWSEIILVLCKNGNKDGAMVVVDDMAELPHIFEEYGYLEKYKWPYPSVNEYPHVAYKIVDSLRNISTTTTTELCELMYRYKSDKCPQIKHFYTPFYHVLFHPRRQYMIKHFMEIGIGSTTLMGPDYTPGASLYGWSQYFPPHTRIYGVDNDKKVINQITELCNANNSRVRVFWGDQSNATSLEQLYTAMGSPCLDVIIDDGSHKLEDQITSFKTLYKYVNPNSGLYIIEDVTTNNYDWQKMVDGMGVEKTTTTTIKVEVLTWSHHIPDDRLVIFWFSTREDVSEKPQLVLSSPRAVKEANTETSVVLSQSNTIKETSPPSIIKGTNIEIPQTQTSTHPPLLLPVLPPCHLAIPLSGSQMEKIITTCWERFNISKDQVTDVMARLLTTLQNSSDKHVKVDQKQTLIVAMIYCNVTRKYVHFDIDKEIGQVTGILFPDEFIHMV